MVRYIRLTKEGLQRMLDQAADDAATRAAAMVLADLRRHRRWKRLMLGLLKRLIRHYLTTLAALTLTGVTGWLVLHYWHNA